MNRIDFAQTFATAAHAGQVRPYTGEPYIGHPARVVGILQGIYPNAIDELVIAAWLHDVQEDCQITSGALVQSFGPFVAALVGELSKPNEPTSTAAMLVKACDLIDNVGTIADVVPAKYMARDYLTKKAPQVLRISESLAPTYPELAATLARAFWRNWSAVA